MRTYVSYVRPGMIVFPRFYTKELVEARPKSGIGYGLSNDSGL
jgi:hypothetical protein